MLRAAEGSWGAPRPRAAPQRVPEPRLGTVIPDPTPAPTRIRIELRYARPGPVWRGRLGSYRARPACAGSARAVRRRGHSLPVQRGGNAGHEGVLSQPPRPLRAPARPARGSEHTPPAPSRRKLQLIRFFAALFSDVFLSPFVSFGRAEWGPEKQTHNQPGGGEVGRRGLRGRRGRGVARSSSPPPPRRPPRRPRARGAWLGGQLLYWHALRPEAGPCRPP